MSKIADLKIKVIDGLGKLKDKLPTIRKKKDAGSESSASSNKAKTAPKTHEPKLGDIYKEAKWGSKMLIYSIFFFLLLGLSSSFYLGLRIYKILKSAQSLKSSQQEYTDKFEQLSHKASEAASIVSMGSITVNSPDGKTNYTIDIWLRCDSPRTARKVQSLDIRLRDLIIGVLRDTSETKHSILTDEGKHQAKLAIIQILNKELVDGKVHEVFFYNLVSD